MSAQKSEGRIMNEFMEGRCLPCGDGDVSMGVVECVCGVVVVVVVVLEDVLSEDVVVGMMIMVRSPWPQLLLLRRRERAETLFRIRFAVPSRCVPRGVLRCQSLRLQER